MSARNGHFHAVRFYENAAALSQIVASFLTEGFHASQSGVIIATPVHCAAIEKRLGERSLDVDQLKRDGSLLVIDADEMLAKLMVDGMPDSMRFHHTLVPVIEKACGGRQDRVVRAYGEMVDVLWKADQTVAATRLETLWNVLANNHAFSLLCGYAMGSVYKNAAIDEICSHHSHVITMGGDLVAVQ
jgi:MEDS: MEthanogen/methylotroph, DcmR Sensory domain